MKQTIKIAILGGGGRTGTFLVAQLLEQGYSLKLLLRNPDFFPIQNPSIEIIHGDAINAASVNELLKDCQAVINVLSQRPGEPMVASRATENVLNAMQNLNISRYLLLAGINVDTPYDNKGPETKAATEWMKNNFPTIHDDRQKTYAILVNSQVEWTLVRVPLIEFSEGNGNLKVDLQDCPGNKIKAGDIAGFLIDQLVDSTYVKKSPFITN